MISLDNTYNEDDLNDFDKRVKKNINSIKNNLINQEENINIVYTLEFKFD
jgi:NAD-dependent DNA ligase